LDIEVHTMRWFRSNRRSGAGLALFALVLQLVVSFGHVHATDLVPATTTTAQSATAQSSHAPDPSSPVKRSNGAGDICAICALIQLVNTSVASSAPLLPQAAATYSIRWSIAFDFNAPPPPRRPFSARAPPLA
jgi:hypothetical protein